MKQSTRDALLVNAISSGILLVIVGVVALVAVLR